MRKWESVQSHISAHLRTCSPAISALSRSGHKFSYHCSQLLRLSQDLPVVIEVVDTPEKIDGVMPQIDEFVQDGLVTLEKVRVVRYAAKS